MHARGALIVVMAAAAAGCGHGEPFSNVDYHPVEPHVPGVVARLTYSTMRDQSTSWSPHGIYYTYEQPTGVFRSWCLGLLPATGGSRSRSWCPIVPDTQVAYNWAIESGGRLAYLRAAGVPFAIAPVTWSVTVAADGNPLHGVPLSPVVVAPPGSVPLQGAEQLRWIDSTRLVWVGTIQFAGAPCRGCAIDTVSSGRVLLTQDIRQPGLPTALPGTDYATSVAVRGPDELLFTRGGDARIYRMVLSTGAVTVLHDLSAHGIARDIQVVGDKAVLVAGGNVSWGFSTLLGDSAQDDLGGNPVIVHLSLGAVIPLSLGFPVRYPALDAGGSLMTVQTGAMPEDLWLVAIP